MPRPGTTARPPRILVADDDETTRTMYAFFLEHAGLQVDVAADGPEILMLAADQRPDVVVTDLAMPTMNGLAVTRRLKADSRTATIRVIAVTGHQSELSEDEARLAGCDAYLIKPCLPEALLAEVRRQLAGRARPPA
jgi:CheY-like chemotaxis protein